MISGAKPTTRRFPGPTETGCFREADPHETEGESRLTYRPGELHAGSRLRPVRRLGNNPPASLVRCRDFCGRPFDWGAIQRTEWSAHNYRVKNVIEIRDLYKYYGQRRALGPVTTKIDQGEIVGLLGLNGAGKTTALRILACDLLPSSGTVTVGGVDVVERPDAVREKIGYLPDTPPLYGEMRVAEFLGYAARLRGIRKADIPKMVEEAIGLTRLKDVRNDPIGSLSHGYRQRVGIAQAIVHQPQLVVLDEPISGLDPVQIVDMRRTVRNLGGKHTVLVSSHILSEISETCDRLLVIKNGEIVAQGTEAELSKQLLQGVRVRITVRTSEGSTNDAVQQLLRGLAGVKSVEPVSTVEPGERICSFALDGGQDVREAISAAIVGAGHGLIEMTRHEHELESVFLRLAAPQAGTEALASDEAAA